MGQKKFIIALCCSTMFFISCSKCKECYLIEGNGNNKVETSIGEFCGDDLEEQENRTVVCIDNCYIECR